MKEIKEYTGVDYDYHSSYSIADFNDLDNLVNNEFDAIWIMGNVETVTLNLLSAINDKVRQGVGLVLLGGDHDCSYVADAVLHDIKPDWNLKFESRNYDPGDQLVAKGNTGSRVLYDHPVTSGLYRDVSEGTSIAYFLPRNDSKPSIKDKDIFKPIILNSSSHISVAAVEEELSNGVSGYSRAKKKNGKILQRTLMHGGFTSLYRQNEVWAWRGSDSGTAHFFYNIACWSSGAQ